jgi:siroheme synthase-like protein
LSTLKEHNTLFPVFLKLEKLTTLVVGGGYVATEKLRAIFQNNPRAIIKLVAPEISPEVRSFISKYSIPCQERPFIPSDLENIDLAIIAINDEGISKEIYAACALKKVLTNVADKPELCDFYLSSVVQKGNLKIAISTNGKSPTIAKRIKEMLNEVFPDQIDAVLDNMESIRNKIRQLNDITSVLADEKKTRPGYSGGLSIILYLAAALGLMVLGHILFSWVY